MWKLALSLTTSYYSLFRMDMILPALNHITSLYNKSSSSNFVALAVEKECMTRLQVVHHLAIPPGRKACDHRAESRRSTKHAIDP